MVPCCVPSYLRSFTKFPYPQLGHFSSDFAMHFLCNCCGLKRFIAINSYPYYMTTEIKNALEKAAEIYSQSALLRAEICGIPFIGSSIDAFFGTRGQNIIQRRIFHFINKLKSEIAKLEEKKVDKEYIISEEFFDLMFRAFEYTGRTRDDSKIELYAKILRGAVNIDNRNEYDPEEYLEVIKELTPFELKVAKAIFEQQASKDWTDAEISTMGEVGWARSKGWDKLSDTCEVSQEELRFLLIRIERTGLIKEITGSYYDYSGGVYVITDMFRKIMKFISE